MQFDLSTISPARIYHMMTQTIMPRPIAWIMTDNGNNSFNLAPFSYFSPISNQPPTVMFSIGKQANGEDKDTVRNIKNNPYMVIHIPTVAHAEAVAHSALNFDSGVSEVNEIGLALTDFCPNWPRISDCPVAFLAKLDHIHTLEGSQHQVVFARVEQVYIADEFAHFDQTSERLTVDAQGLQPLARLGGPFYTGIAGSFTAPPPGLASSKKQPK